MPDNRLALVQHVPGQPDFLLQRRQIPTARTAPGAAAHQEQTVTDIACLRDRSLLGERPEVSETDTPPLQVIFHQAKVIGRGVLNDIESVHSLSQRILDGSDEIVR